MPPDYCAIANIIIDDILLWDGRIMLNCLGGSGTYSISGMRVWNSNLGFVSRVGGDFQPEHRARLEALGVDFRGIIVDPTITTSRAWQIFHPDEERIEVYRTKEAIKHRATVRFELCPEEFLQAKGFHIFWDQPLADLIPQIPPLRRRNPGLLIIWEPAEKHQWVGEEEYRRVLPLVDVFSPNLLEGSHITRQSDPRTICSTLIDWGARGVALRMGEEGSLTLTAGGEGWVVPAAPLLQRVDVTGAGNAYCGGLLVGLGEGRGWREASAMASVSASFAIEQFSVPVFRETLPQERSERLEAVLGGMKPL